MLEFTFGSWAAGNSAGCIALHTPCVVAVTFLKWLGESRIIKYTDVVRVQETRHALGVAGPGNVPVIMIRSKHDSTPCGFAAYRSTNAAVVMVKLPTIGQAYIVIPVWFLLVRLRSIAIRSISCGVLILLKAVSSGKGTSMQCSRASQWRNARPPSERKSSIDGLSVQLQSRKVGCRPLEVHATAISASAAAKAWCKRTTMSHGSRGASQGTQASSGVSARPIPACKPASGPG